jgi:hypothetical protein
MRGEDIVKYIRVQSIKWWGQLNRRKKINNNEEDCGIESHRSEIKDVQIIYGKMKCQMI